jgi:flagellum-specific peptidoglycan hydrolase FlgJ
MKIMFLLVPLAIASHAKNKRMTPALSPSTRIEIAQRVKTKTGIPIPIILGQCSLESANGHSSVAKHANNYFGVKGRHGYHGYKMYKNPIESFQDYAHLLISNPYIVRHRKNLGSTNYIAWAYALQKANYASNPHYATDLIHRIRDNHLDHQI